MRGFMFAPSVTRHAIWKPHLGQTTTTTTTTAGPGVTSTQVTPGQSGGADMITIVILAGAALVVTEALGVTHVRKWFSKTLGLSGSKKK